MVSIFKISYDFKRTFWQSFGRVAFIECEPAAAEALARETVERLEPGATITRLAITSATEQQRARFHEKVRAYETWLLNVANGIPNRRESI